MKESPPGGKSAYTERATAKGEPGDYQIRRKWGLGDRLSLSQASREIHKDSPDGGSLQSCEGKSGHRQN